MSQPEGGHQTAVQRVVTTVSKRAIDYSKHPAVVAINARKDTIPSSTRLARALRITGVTVSLVTFGLILNLLQLLTLPISFFSQSLSHRLNSYATHFAWTLCDYFISGQDNVRMTLSGLDGIPVGESAVVISNHVYFGDFFLIHAIARKKQMMAYCRYFLKDSIKYIPIFGWGMYLCNMPFLKRDWQRDNRRLDRSLKTLIDHRLPVWLVSHVEGSRLSSIKREKSQKYARANDLPVLENVLLPRCKGFTSTIHSVTGSHIKDVYDITLAYFHNRKGFAAKPNLFEILTGGLDEYQFHAHIDRIPLREIPQDENGMSNWLYDRYQQKDRLLESIKQAFKNHV